MSNNKQFQADHGDAFRAESITIMHGEGKIVLDFKNTTPRFDQFEGDSQHTLITEHDAVTMEPRTAKMLLKLLQDNIEDYEEQFGEIELPEQEDGGDEQPEDAHGYIG